MAKKPLPTAIADDFPGMTLLRMRTENVKRVRLVDVTFEQPLTLIGGDNAQGKTSYLDSYVFCLGGKAVIQMDPIHHGKQSGSITCEFGVGETVQMAVTRTIRKLGDGDDFTAEVDVEIPGHITPTKVQTFLDKLAGAMSLDPMSFDEEDDATRFEILRKFVSGFDFDANKKADETARKERTDINRDQKREQAAADTITTGPVPPCQPIDEAALTLQLKEAGEKNTDRATRAANREKATARVAELRFAAEVLLADATHLPERIAAAHNKRVTDHDAVETAARARMLDMRMQIRALEEKIVREESDLRDATQAMEEGKALDTQQLEADAQHQVEKAKVNNDAANELVAKIEAAGPLPPLEDADAISAKLEAARAANARYAAWKQQRDKKAAYQAEADRLAKESEELDGIIVGLKKAKQDAIEAAKLPVAGLGIEDGYITLNGVTWSQASRAERIDASTAIAMALNPKLKVILIRDGSNLGKAMKERIRQRAIEHGYRVLMEVVDDTGGTHVVIEDGVVISGSHQS